MRRWLLFPVLLASMPLVRAHCPLCTVGAVAAAGGAAYLGVNLMVVGVFLGAFAVSMGWWLSRLIKRQFIPRQREALIILSFVTTVLPLLPIIGALRPFYIPWIGVYGLTIAYDAMLVGSLLGGGIVMVTPWLSRRITSLRGRMVPYQGMMLTFGLLLITGTLIQVIA